MLQKIWNLLKQISCPLFLRFLTDNLIRNPPGHKSWENVFSGVEYVMHVASPHTLLFDNQQIEILDPAILGTQVPNEYCVGSHFFRRFFIIVTNLIR